MYLLTTAGRPLRAADGQLVRGCALHGRHPPRGHTSRRADMEVLLLCISIYTFIVISFARRVPSALLYAPVSRLLTYSSRCPRDSTLRVRRRDRQRRPENPCPHRSTVPSGRPLYGVTLFLVLYKSTGHASVYLTLLQRGRSTTDLVTNSSLEM